MENIKNSVYKFKPYEFTLLENNEHPSLITPRFIGVNHSLASTEAYLIAYGGVRRTNTKLKKYFFDSREWKTIICQGIPENLELSEITLLGNLIILHNRIDMNFETELSNDYNMYIGNLADEYKKDGMKFQRLELSIFPKQLNILTAMEGENMFLVSCDSSDPNKFVHQLDLNTRKLEVINQTSDITLDFPQKIILYKNTIYVFGRNLNAFHTFNLATKSWEILRVQMDELPYIPSIRVLYGCVQSIENRNLVYVCGGRNLDDIFNDVLRLDLNILRWDQLTKFTLPRPLYWHSATVTPSGRLCYYYGIHDTGKGNPQDIPSAWITIPKLKIISWEAMVYYFKEQMFDSTIENLKKIGLPCEFYNRIIEAREDKSSLNCFLL